MMSHARQRAFTLAEILVVVVILGIAAAVVVPNLASRDDLKAAAAARMVMADLIYAQNRAIATQTRHYIIFSPSATPQSYRLATSITPLVDISHPVSKASTYVVNFGASGNTGLETISLGSVSFENRTTLVFDELGVPYYYDSSTATATALTQTGGSVIPVRCGNHTVTIAIQPYTGELTAN